MYVRQSGGKNAKAFVEKRSDVEKKNVEIGNIPQTGADLKKSVDKP